MNDYRQWEPDSDPLLSKEEKRNHCTLDRRAGFDRRRAYRLAYFARGGTERRRVMERRQRSDRRRYWEMRGTPCAISSD